MPLGLYRRPGSPNWWIRGTIRGRRLQESSGTRERALAEEYRAAREAELYRAAIHGTAAPVAFASAAFSYLDVEPRSPATLRRVGRLLPAIGPHLTCRQVDQAMLDVLARELLRPGASPATRLREIVTPVRTILQHAARRGWCDRPLFEGARLAPSRTTWLTPAEAEQLIAAAAPHFQPLLTWLFCTGCRVGESLALDWRDVDLAHARASVHQPKTGRDRIVVLPPRLIAELANLVHREGAVFRRPDGLPYAPKDGLGGGQVKRAWAGALRRAGITKPATPHTCRHTWASWHYAVHRDPMLLRGEGGWRSILLVERYAHLAPDGVATSALEFWGQSRYSAAVREA